jgi:hypothetical protein
VAGLLGHGGKELCSGRAKKAGGARVPGGGYGVERCKEGRSAFKGGRAVILACALGKEGRWRSQPGISGPLRERGGGGGDGPERWVRAVSGRRAWHGNAAAVVRGLTGGPALSVRYARARARAVAELTGVQGRPRERRC